MATTSRKWSQIVILGGWGVAPNKHSADRVAVQARIPKDLHRLVVAKMEMEGQSLTDVITDLLRAYVSR